ncbi:MAG: DinB family protein [Chloroflexota bacterium]|nr:DinB family protein [Chloroflexota bacterium]
MTDQPTAAQPRLVTCDPVAGYAPQIGRYVAQLAEVRDHLHEQVVAFTVAQLDWHPDAQTESVGTLLLHLDAVEWSWMHQDIFGAADDAYPGSWDEALPIRAAVPQVSGRPLARYLDQLAATRAETLRLLASFTDADLPRLVGEAPPPPGRAARSELYTIDWIIWHVIEHEATHVGQVELLKRWQTAESDHA